MDIRSIRRANARRIAEEVGGASALAKRLGIPTSGVSQVIGRNPRRNIGDHLARRIEAAGGYNSGWLDRDHSTPTESERAAGAVDVDLLVEALKRTDGEIRRLSLNLTDDQRSELLARAAATVYAYTLEAGAVTPVDPSLALRLLLRSN